MNGLLNLKYLYWWEFPQINIIIMPEKILKKYTAKLDSKKRMTIRDAESEYYEVNIFKKGYIIMRPKVLVDAEEISSKTLNMMDKSVSNFKKRKSSTPVDFQKYIKMLEQK